MLNLLLYQLTHKPVDPGLMEFLRIDEHLVDIGDDLVDYEVSDGLDPLWSPFLQSIVDSFALASAAKFARRSRRYDKPGVEAPCVFCKFSG